MTDREDRFVDGPVSPDAGDETAARWRMIPDVGAAIWFSGHVRADEIDTGVVTAIDYTAYRPLADDELDRIVAEVAAADGVIDVFVRHALGIVPVGGVAMLVGVAAGHRREAFTALARVVDEIKARVPIYGKELTDTDGYRWKVNT